MSKVLVPPIKSQGIKTKLVPWIEDALSWDRRGVWIEPFMGQALSGSTLRLRKPVLVIPILTW